VAKKIRMMFREDWEAKHKPKPPRPEPSGLKRVFSVAIDKLRTEWERACNGCGGSAVWNYDRSYRMHDGGGGTYYSHISLALCHGCKEAAYTEDGRTSRWDAASRDVLVSD